MPGIAVLLKALANPNRIRVFQIICKASGRKGPGPTIEQICRAAGMKQPAVSHHVAKLAAAGLVERTKSAWWVHCAPSEEGLELLRRFARDPAGFPPP